VAVLIATWESELASDALPPAISFRAKRGYATVIAAGVLGAYGESSRGFGGALAVTAGREPSPWALGGSLGATVHEQQPLGRGKIGWFRVLLGLGGERRFRPGGVALALRGEAVGALLHASAHGYETNRSRSFASAGLAGGLRVDVGYAYVDLGGAAWLRREHLRIDGVAGDVELPRVELLLGVGVRAGGP